MVPRRVLVSLLGIRGCAWTMVRQQSSRARSMMHPAVVKHSRRRGSTVVRMSTSSRLVDSGESLPYSGVLARLRAEDWEGSSEEDDFGVALKSALKIWRTGHISVWLALPVALSRFAATAADQGFELHHTEIGELILYRWLGEGPDKVPPMPRTQVGCAGMVIDAEGKVLVIKEWNRSSKEPSDHWKLPGGLADRGESLFDCAARETFEETGVATRGKSLLGFWHRHDVGPWALSDVYAVVQLELLPDADITLKNLCPDEISMAKWVDLQEFARTDSHPLILKIASLFGVSRSRPLIPLAEMRDVGVQWPGRPRIPTFLPSVNPFQMPTRIRAVASDVDGTLLGSNSKLLDVNARTIMELFENTDVAFFVATGKCREGARNALLPIKRLVDDGVFVNGLVVYSGGKVIFERTLESDVLRDAAAFAEQIGADLVAYCRDDLLCRCVTERTEELAARYMEPRPRKVDTWDTVKPNKVLLLATEETCAAARADLEAALMGRAAVTMALPTMLEVLPYGASKREGVAAYCSYIGVDESTELAAVGDGENDAEMLRHAALGMALANGSPVAKNAADLVLASNDQAGASAAFRIAAALFPLKEA